MMLDDPLVRAFEAAAIDPERFGHREHLYVAWCYLRELSLEETLVRYVTHLRRLTIALGVPEKYHATITWAYLVLLHGAMRDDESFQELLERHPSLLDHKKGMLSQYYSMSELDSPIARERFVLPRGTIGR